MEFDQSQSPLLEVPNRNHSVWFAVLLERTWLKGNAVHGHRLQGACPFFYEQRLVTAVARYYCSLPALDLPTLLELKREDFSRVQFESHANG